MSENDKLIKVIGCLTAHFGDRLSAAEFVALSQGILKGDVDAFNELLGYPVKVKN